MTITGKTGADAAFKLAAAGCRLFDAYEPKLRKLVADLLAANVISSGDAVLALTWIDATKVACPIIRVLADNSNVT